MMTMTKNKKRKAHIIENILESLFIFGEITDKDIQSKQKRSKILEGLEKQLSSKKSSFITLCYRESLLKTAESFKREKEFDFAKIFYAIFFEHTINSIIDIKIKQNRFSENLKMNIIRNINVYGKFTWLLELLQLPVFNKIHLKTIEKLMDDRNSFIHYKYKLRNIDDDFDLSGIKKLKEFNEINKAINYIKRYESKIAFRGKKKKIKTALKLITKS